MKNQVNRKSAIKAAPKSKKVSVPNKCRVCYKVADFCHCSVEDRALDVFNQQAKTLRAGVLAEVAEWIASQASMEVKPKRAEKLAVMAEAVAQDRML